MTLEKIYDMELIGDNTKIYVRHYNRLSTIESGYWYQDQILKYMKAEIESFTWQDDNRLFIDVILNEEN